MQYFTNAKQIVPYLQQLYGKRNIAQVERYADILSHFKHMFGGDGAFICSSSGRVEFVGNHTDHNGGRVIGCAISLDIVVAFRPTCDNTIVVEGKGRNPIKFSLDDDAKLYGSAGLVKGVALYLKQQGYNVGGFVAYSDSTVPVGAGVSSSAAFELAIGSILNACYNNGTILPQVLARAGQYAENNFFNKPCGLLDQSVVAFGGVVSLDFRNGVEAQNIVTDLTKLQLVLVDTGTSHASLSELYASIPRDMKAVANYFNCDRLIDVDKQQFCDRLDYVQQTIGLLPTLRSKHFFEENTRVVAMEQALAQSNVEKVVQLINSSGDSSQYQLQNCAVDESDTVIADVIATARSVSSRCGARVHGGGFAGTVLCVLPADLASDFIVKMRAIYGDEKIIPLKIRSVGTSVL